MNRFPVKTFVLCLFIHLACAASFSSVQHDGDALLLVETNKISRILLSTTKNEILIDNLTDARSVDYDIKRNCIFWSVYHSQQVIHRKCAGQSAEVLHRTSGDGEYRGRIAYDWTSQLLYFTNYSYASIEVISTAPNRPRLHRTIVKLKSTSKPFGIVVHPRRGYLFWTNIEPNTHKIGRANLDGNDKRMLVQSSKIDDRSEITIDYENDFIFWTDDNTDDIAGCDINGRHHFILLRDPNLIKDPFTLSMYHEFLYLGDMKRQTLSLAKVKQYDIVHNKPIYLTADITAEINTIHENVSYYDVRVIAAYIQSGSSACGEHHICSHFCVSTPKNTYSCLCPDGMKLSKSGQCVCLGSHLPLPDGKCPALTGLCAAGQFECLNHECVDDFKRCDGDDDCGDGSDEDYCEPCPPHLFQCKSDGRCIPEELWCDHHYDCSDSSDELGCATNESMVSNEPVNITFDAEQSILRWEMPADSNAPSSYAVFYGESLEDYKLGPKLTTEKLEAKLSVRPCTKYIAGVSIVDDEGQSQLPRNYLRITTPYDGQLPPHSLQMFVKGTDIRFSWESSCKYSNQPSYYLFQVHDVTLNRRSFAHVHALLYRYGSNWSGAEFVFSVATPTLGAEPAVVHHRTPPLPTPGFFQMFADGNWTFYCNWESVEFHEMPFSYELVAAPGIALNESSSDNFVLALEKPPMIIRLQPLASSISAATVFTAGIRIRTVMGHPSAVQATQLFQLQPLPDRCRPGYVDECSISQSLQPAQSMCNLLCSELHSKYDAIGQFYTN